MPALFILKEHEADVKTADLCRKHGVSDASFYNWKAKYGGLEVSEAMSAGASAIGDFTCCCDGRAFSPGSLVMSNP